MRPPVLAFGAINATQMKRGFTFITIPRCSWMKNPRERTIYELLQDAVVLGYNDPKKRGDIVDNVTPETEGNYVLQMEGHCRITVVKPNEAGDMTRKTTQTKAVGFRFPNTPNGDHVSGLYDPVKVIRQGEDIVGFNTSYR